MRVCEREKRERKEKERKKESKKERKKDTKYINKWSSIIQNISLYQIKSQ